MKDTTEKINFPCALLLGFHLAASSFILPPVLSFSAVKEIDLALWRSAEAIAGDKREFMNDGEWELLSVPSQYWHIRQDDADYAQIQFNVRRTRAFSPREDRFYESNYEGGQ